MGDWKITIKGVGCHHNGKPYDSNVMATALVRALKESGHTISSALFTYGDSKEDDLSASAPGPSPSSRPESD